MPLDTCVYMVREAPGVLAVETHTLDEWMVLFDRNYTLATSFKSAKEARALKLDHLRHVMAKHAHIRVNADKHLFYLQVDGTRIVELGAHDSFDDAERAVELWQAAEAQKAGPAWVPGMTYIHDYASLRSLQDSINPLLT